MKLYVFLRQFFHPSGAVIGVSLWYGVLLALVFIGLSQIGTDLRYAHL